MFFQFYLAATVLTVLPVAADLTNRRLLLRRVRRSEEQFRLLAEHSSDLLMHLTVDGRFRYVAPSMWQTGGYDPEKLIGKHAGMLIAPQHRQQVLLAHYATVQSPGITQTYRYLGVIADGSMRWFETHARAICDEEGRVDGVLSIVRDITHVHQREESLAAAALCDDLTGLPNRRAFEARVQERLRNTGPGRDCVALLDIDHFKQVNDSYGHDAGDAVLRGFARTLATTVRSVDLAARLGGEEFVILFPDTSPEQAMQISERVRQQVARSGYPAGPASVQVTVSGGVAALGSDGLKAALKVADVALYSAKSGGRDQLHLAA
jgi:diguanylate cyclase (GGDEF)-like protein/PAS domain S-box-containing protein